jgi:hypothetical protein
VPKIKFKHRADPSSLQLEPFSSIVTGKDIPPEGYVRSRRVRR